jgi:hypothetical protein
VVIIKKLICSWQFIYTNDVFFYKYEDTVTLTQASLEKKMPFVSCFINTRRMINTLRVCPLKRFLYFDPVLINIGEPSI